MRECLFIWLERFRGRKKEDERGPVPNVSVQSCMVRRKTFSWPACFLLYTLPKDWSISYEQLLMKFAWSHLKCPGWRCRWCAPEITLVPSEADGEVQTGAVANVLLKSPSLTWSWWRDQGWRCGWCAPEIYLVPPEADGEVQADAVTDVLLKSPSPTWSWWSGQGWRCRWCAPEIS